MLSYRIYSKIAHGDFYLISHDTVVTIHVHVASLVRNLSHCYALFIIFHCYYANHVMVCPIYLNLHINTCTCSWGDRWSLSLVVFYWGNGWYQEAPRENYDGIHDHHPVSQFILQVAVQPCEQRWNRWLPSILREWPSHEWGKGTITPLTISPPLYISL